MINKKESDKLNEEEFRKILIECFELGMKKNKDYGCDSLIRFGNTGIFVRVSDKFDRLYNLIFKNKKPEINEEKIEDTLKDVINYCCYMIMQQRGKLIKNASAKNN